MSPISSRGGGVWWYFYGTGGTPVTMRTWVELFFVVGVWFSVSDIDAGFGHTFAEAAMF